MRVLLAAGGMHPEPGGVPLVSGQGGLSADAAAAALRSGWLAARPDDEVTALPVPDGGLSVYAPESARPLLDDAEYRLLRQR